MDYLDYIPDAIEMVASWNISDNELIEAVHQQANLMVDIQPFYRPLTTSPIQLPLDLH